MTDALLALNAGSSSFKFVIARADALDQPVLGGSAERLGSEQGVLSLKPAQGPSSRQALPDATHQQALTVLFDALAEHCPGLTVRGIGHRIVHGGAIFTDPVRITPDVVGDLTRLVPLAPLHQPHGLAAIDAARARYPEAIQVACFDTAFHAGKPWIHQAIALPKRYYTEGVRRYGFHGIACESITSALIADGFPLEERAIAIAHLGNGCSVTAVKNGRALATSMGFSALDGLTMGTRCGHIDPGVLLHLLRNGHDADSLERLLYREAGLLGLSGLSNDMRDLAASDSDDARDAIAFFIARAVEEISRMAGVMGGLDCVVFSGGIGENAADIRHAVMKGLSFLPGREGTGIECKVQPADEEDQLLRAAKRFL
ncbi:acetate/propionate family kinase [Tropicimonas sp. S265A]|uniref:acetate/propionate family kinase n=1 Tax=Tropicimonas sp. S265A TaxID=3415134 RepID=UPI003C7CAFAE